MANKSISQLTSAAAVAETDLLATAIVDGGSATGYATRKHTVADVGAHIGTTKTFAGLNTTSKNLVGAANEVLSNFADEYDDTATYAVGDIVVHEGGLYKCITAVSTAESFDSTKWTKGTAADFFGGGDNGAQMQVIAEQHAVWSSTAPSSFTSNSFSVRSGDLIIVAILKMPAKYTQISSQLFSNANDTLYTFSFFAATNGTEQFTANFSDTQRTEVCVLQIRGATDASLQINTVYTGSTQTTSAITPPAGNSVTFISRRYTNFGGSSGMQLNTRQLAVYEAKPVANGQWILAGVNFCTFNENNFVVSFDQATPYAIAGISLDSATV